MALDLQSTLEGQRVIVVGGGVFGTMHAYLALEHGAEVVHLERDRAPMGASVRNFGLVWVSGRGEGRETELALRARELWESIAREVPDIKFRANGSFTLLANDEELEVARRALQRPSAKLRGFDLMNQGRVEQVATPAELYAHPSSGFVAEFVGVSSRVPVERQGADIVLFERAVAVRGGATGLGAGPLDALLRPEDVSVRPDQAGAGVVQHRNFLGATTRLEVGFADVIIKTDVRSSESLDYEVGTRVTLELLAHDVLVTPRRVPSVDHDREGLTT